MQKMRMQLHAAVNSPTPAVDRGETGVSGVAVHFLGLLIVTHMGSAKSISPSAAVTSSNLTGRGGDANHALCPALPATAFWPLLLLLSLGPSLNAWVAIYRAFLRRGNLTFQWSSESKARAKIAGHCAQRPPAGTREAESDQNIMYCCGSEAQCEPCISFWNRCAAPLRYRCLTGWCELGQIAANRTWHACAQRLFQSAFVGCCAQCARLLQGSMPFTVYQVHCACRLGVPRMQNSRKRTVIPFLWWWEAQ